MSGQQILSNYRHYLKNAVVELQILCAQNERSKLSDHDLLERVEDISERIISETEAVREAAIDGPSSQH